MSFRLEPRALSYALEQLAELLNVPADDVIVESSEDRVPGLADALVRAGDYRFLVEFKARGDAATVSRSLKQLATSAEALGRPAIPLLLVPFMSESGRRMCEEAGAAWLDMSGNASISAPGLRILLDGRPNRYKPRGRPANPFAPKSARVTRELLLHPEDWFSQRELARETGLDEGFVSRVVRRLEEDALLERDRRGALRPADPDLLLDAWHDVYDFSRHQVLRGHVAARDGDDLLRRVPDAFRRADVRYAATGLAAGWLYVHHATFRVASFYVDAPPRDDLLDDLGFRGDESGSNLWLVVPNDEGVFAGGSDRDGVICASAVQTYLDLKGHPERAIEVAAELRRELLAWTRHGR